MCDRVAVMYAGRMVESGGVRDLFNNPKHPYTQALMASVPHMERTDRLFEIKGQPPALYALPKGCRFTDRGSYAKNMCFTEYPPRIQAEQNHGADCWMLGPAWEEAAFKA